MFQHEEWTISIVADENWQLVRNVSNSFGAPALISLMALTPNTTRGHIKITLWTRNMTELWTLWPQKNHKHVDLMKQRSDSDQKEGSCNTVRKHDMDITEYDTNTTISMSPIWNFASKLV